MLALAVALAMAIAMVIFPAASAGKSKEPPITVRPALMNAAFHCHGSLGVAREAIMLVTGTGSTGEETYAFGKAGFRHYGHPVCDVDFPDFETADIQVSAQYLVYAIRREYQLSGRRIAVFGLSQGGLLARFALTYWPDLRRKVSDVIAAAGTMHGTTVGSSSCSAKHPCPPAVWQQAAGSHLLRALGAQPIEAPGPTSWTTVRSASDDVVQPQTGKHPTSALRGATNFLIQSICPGRRDTHLGTFVDSVTFAALADAIAHPGPAKRSRLPRDVCSKPYAPGLDAATTTSLLAAANVLLTSQTKKVPAAMAEPKVLSYFLR